MSRFTTDIVLRRASLRHQNWLGFSPSETSRAWKTLPGLNWHKSKFLRRFEPVHSPPVLAALQDSSDEETRIQMNRLSGWWRTTYGGWRFSEDSPELSRVALTAALALSSAESQWKYRL